MRSKSKKIISVLIALALSLNGGLPVIAEALSTGMEEIQDQVSEYVDDEVNQEGSEISEAIKVLIELVAELPEVSFITEENKEAILLDFEAVTIAYELLSEEDKVIFELTPQYTKLMAIQAMLLGTELIPEQLDLLQRGEWNQAELSLDEQLEYIQLVQRLSEESGVMMMGLDDTDLPFQIGTATQLADLAKKVNEGNEDFDAKSYILANDIDLSAYQRGTGWTPIGNNNNPFNGTFDGNGKIINSLVINN